MKNLGISLLSTSLLVLSTSLSQTVIADSVAQALKEGQVSGDFNFRYETVEQDNSLKDATALTLRSRLSYKTGVVNGFSAVLEFEDVRKVLGQDEYANPVDGTAGYSVIADPESTELDQAYIQYATDTFSAKLGSQVITLDGHRFVGHVGWRQDRQTFDAASIVYKPSKAITVMYANIFERNRIFADKLDQKSKDNVLNISWKTDVGKLTTYAYLLEDDFGLNATRDTFGARFSGAGTMDGVKLIYGAEWASQSFENNAGADFDADYMMLEAGVVLSGVTAKLGYEVLGSDQGGFGFATPLATLHKFNGWSDQFLATPTQGLVDVNLTLAMKAGLGKLTVMYHDFSADEASASVDDFGSELDVLYGLKFGKLYSVGIKYAAYSAGDTASNKVDADKLWLWLGAKF